MTEPKNKQSLLVHKPIVQKLIDLYGVSNFDKFPDDIIDICNDDNHVKKFTSDTKFLREYIYLMFRIFPYNPHGWYGYEIDIPEYFSEDSISTVMNELKSIGFDMDLVDASPWSSKRIMNFRLV